MNTTTGKTNIYKFLNYLLMIFLMFVFIDEVFYLFVGNYPHRYIIYIQIIIGILMLTEEQENQQKEEEEKDKHLNQKYHTSG